MANIVEELRKYLAETPKEQLEKDWKELEKWNEIGPSVDEFIKQAKASTMTQEKFNKIIIPNWTCNTHDEKILMMGTVHRTIRLCLQYPEFALEYYNALPKVVCD